MTKNAFVLLMFTILGFIVASADKGVIDKYQYTGRDGNVTFHGYFVRTSPHRWIERAEKDGVHVYYFEEIQGETGWITLFDAARGMFARFRTQEASPLELKSKVNEPWVRFWDVEPVLAETPATRPPHPTPTPSPKHSPNTHATSVAIPVNPSSSPAENTQPIQPKSGTWDDKRIATVFGITGLMVMLAIAIFFPHPAPFQYTVFRIVLALAGAGVGATIPGLLDVNVSGIVRATGAIAVFVIVYFFSPAQLLSTKPVSNKKQ